MGRLKETCLQNYEKPVLLNKVHSTYYKWMVMNKTVNRLGNSIIPLPVCILLFVMSGERGSYTNRLWHKRHFGSTFRNRPVLLSPQLPIQQLNHIHTRRSIRPLKQLTQPVDSHEQYLSVKNLAFTSSTTPDPDSNPFVLNSCILLASHDKISLAVGDALHPGIPPLRRSPFLFFSKFGWAPSDCCLGTRGRCL